MQMIISRIWRRWGWLVWFGFGLVGTGCAGISANPLPPTPLMPATSTPISTPTLAPLPLPDKSGGSPNNSLPTPPVAGNRNGSRSAGDPYMPELGNQGYQVLTYTLRFKLNPAVEYIEGHTTIEAVSETEFLRQLSLDLIGFDISQLTANGLPASFRREGGKLVIDLPEPIQQGFPVALDIYYSGKPVPGRSSYIFTVRNMGFNYPGDNTLFTFSEPDGARYWFPANDHPRDKAIFHFELTVPPGMTGIANGRLIQEEKVAAGERFYWAHNVPMATYLAVIVAGNYQRFEDVSNNGVPIRSYISADALALYQQYANVDREAIAWLSNLLGPYPFEVYGYVTVDNPNLSMETQTMVLLSKQLIGPQTLVHELAHAWFGNWVSLDSWAEMWRNEGFATYLALMWENQDDPQGLELAMAGVASAVAGNSQHIALGNPPPEALFGFDVYYQGALLAHALHKEMGDEAFFDGLRQYFATPEAGGFGGSTASQAQFQAVMEAHAGKSLAAFFAEWLN